MFLRKLINRSLISMEVGRGCQGSLMWYILYHYSKQETYFPPPIGKCFSTLLLQQVEGGSSPPPTTLTAQPMKSHHTSNSQFPPIDSLFTQLLLPLCKNVPLLCHLGLAWFTSGPHALNYKSLLLQNKPILPERYLALCSRSSLENLAAQTNLILKV